MEADASLLTTAEEAVKVGESLGASEVEAYVTAIDEKSIVLRNTIETFYTIRTNGLGIRVVIGKKNGFFATSSLSIEDVKRAVKAAFGIAKLNEPDDHWRSLPKKTGTADVKATFDREIEEIEPSALVHGATQMMRSVNHDDRLSITRAEVSALRVETAIVNSYNCDMRREETFASARISVKAEEDGLKGFSSESQQTRSWEDLDCLSIAEMAAERALQVRRAKPIASGVMPVVWHNKLFASVIGLMFRRTLSAESVQKRRSPWIGKIGQRIASENFSLVDNGLLSGGIGTRKFDDDGIPQQKVILVENGVLQNFLYDSYTAQKEARESTGNAHRSYDDLPTPRPNNLILLPERAKREELFQGVKRGLYLVETIGLWLSNPISGDMSATATNAFLIKDGALNRPVKGVIVSGNFFEIMDRKIARISNDTQNRGSLYSPSVKVSEMTVTGQ